MHRRFKYALLLFVLSLSFFSISIKPAYAALFNVLNEAQLITAINIANGNGQADIIDLGGNTINVSAPLPDITSDITIQNGTLDSPGDNYRIFTVTNGVNGHLQITNMTIQNSGWSTTASSGAGGVVLVDDNSLLTISNSIFNNNEAGNSQGGVIYGNSGVQVIINDSVFNNNTAYFGGVMRIFGNNISPASVTITNSIFDNNGTDGTGGNPATREGGVMWNDITVTTITGSTFTNNRASTFGGAIMNRANGSQLHITDSVFRGNTAAIGGAVTAWFLGTTGTPATITNSLFSGNFNNNFSFGSAFHSAGTNASVTNSTFAGNRGGSGTLSQENTGTLTVVNSIIWGNESALLGNRVVNYSDVQGGHPGTGNLDVDPQFTSPVAFASAPTTAGDYTIQSTSPVIDRADNALLDPTITQDLAGNPRRVDVPTSPNNPTLLDMGAYEFGVLLLNVELSTATASGNEGNAGTSAVTAPTLVVGGADTTATGPDTIEIALTGSGANPATLTADYTQSAITVTIPAADYTTPQTIAIPVATLGIVGDLVAENDETLTLTLQNPSAGAVIGDADGDTNTQDTAEYTIINDDTAGIAVTAPLATINEDGATSTTFTIAADTPPTANVDVTLSTDGQCTVPATVTLSAGNTTPVLVTVTAVDDVTPEAATHTCAITTGDPASGDGFYDGLGAVDVADTSVDVLDNDITFTVTNSGATAEGTGTNTTVTFAITPDALGAIVNVGGTVDYTVSDTSGTTTAADFVAALPNGTLTFIAGSGAQTVDIEIVGDNINESDFALEFAVSGQTAGTTGTATTNGAPSVVNVTDDDTAGITLDDSALVTLDEANVATTTTFTLVADTSPTAAVTVPLTTNGECTVSPTDVILPANSTAAQVVTVTVVDDLVAEASPHPCAITTGDPTSGDGFYDALVAADVADTSVDVLDNGIAGVTLDDGGLVTLDEEDVATTTTFTLVADTPPTAAVTIPLTTNGECTISPTDVILPANGTAAQVVTVTVNNDATPEAATHICTITTGDPTSGDGLYDSLGAVDVADTSVDVLDNDIEFTVTNSGATSEGNGTNSTVTFTITPSAAIANVGGTVDYAVSDTSGTTTGADFVVALPSGTLNFAQATGAQTVDIEIVGDLISEPDFILEFDTSAATAGAAGTGSLSGTPSTVNVNDDDAPGLNVIGVPVSELENVGTIIYTLNLDTQPTGDVVITLGSTNPSICTLTTTSITLNDTGWNTATNNVSITVNDNATSGVNPDCVITYTIDGATTATEYAPVTEPDSVIPINDDDTPGIAIAQSDGSSDIAEGGATDTITVALNTQPNSGADVAITITPDAQCEIDGNGASTGVPLTILNADWDTGVTFTVSAIDDSVPEGVHICALTVSAPTSGDADYDGTGAAVTLDGGAFDPTNDTIDTNITDNDVPGVSFSPLTLGEGATETYTIVLNTLPTDTVTVDAIIPDAQCTVSTATPLTFTPADWDTPQTITVTAVDDADVEGPHNCVIVHTLTSTDGDYSGTFDQTITITDNDTLPVSEDPAPGQPDIGSFDPALSKIGTLQPGELGLTGEVLVWDVTAFNAGTADGTNVVITDTLRDELRIEQVNAPGATTSIDGQTVTVIYDRLEPGETVTFNIVTTVINGVQGPLDNTVCLIADGTPEECTTGILIQVLPATGETPIWHTPLILVIGMGTLLSLLGGAWVLRRRWL